MNTTKPAVTAAQSCDTVATGPSAVEIMKALGQSIKGRSRMALIMISGAAMAACGAEAQEAPKTTLVANNTATAPAKVTPASNDADLFATPSEDASDLFALPTEKKLSLGDAMATADERLAGAKADRIAAEGRVEAAEGRVEAAEAEATAIDRIIEGIDSLGSKK